MICFLNMTPGFRFCWVVGVTSLHRALGQPLERWQEAGHPTDWSGFGLPRFSIWMGRTEGQVSEGKKASQVQQQ